MKADAEWFQDSEENNWSWVENGSKITGWKQIDGNWYYFYADGKDGNRLNKKLMESGTILIAVEKMQTGWIKEKILNGTI